MTQQADRELEMRLTMAEGGHRWLINGNESMMFHPMHVHGHTFAVTGPGTRKDTVNVLPMQRLSVDLEANNPGQWLAHCHNVHHGELAMMTVLSYVEQP